MVEPVGNRKRMSGKACSGKMAQGKLQELGVGIDWGALAEQAEG
jgi:hypothetical protein